MSICVYLQATQVELRFANREKYELEKRVETQQSMMDNMHRQLLGIQSEFELSGEGQGKQYAQYVIGTWVHGYMFVLEINDLGGKACVMSHARNVTF